MPILINGGTRCLYGFVWQAYHNGDLQRHLDEARKRIAALERENKDYLILLQETQIGAQTLAKEDYFMVR